jgi:hypothetical protein
MDERIDLTNKKFGRWKVVKFVGRDKSGKHSLWECKCKCGNFKTVYGGDLKRGDSKSCGCLRKEVTAKRSLKHGFSQNGKHHSFYQSWASMKKRCNNLSDTNYKNYGARGIVYDPNWDSFNCFKEDMYFKYLYSIKQLGIKQPSLEREDVNRGYEFDNCIFIEWADQAKNRQHHKWFKAISPIGNEFIDKNKTQFAKDHNLDVRLVRRSLNDKRYNSRSKWRFKYITIKQM